MAVITARERNNAALNGSNHKNLSRNNSNLSLSGGSNHSLSGGSNHSLSGGSNHGRVGGGRQRKRNSQKSSRHQKNNGELSSSFHGLASSPLSNGGGGGLSSKSCHTMSSLDVSNSSRGSKFQHSYKKPDLPMRSQYLAMDCEMVGSVSGESMCARVVLTNWKAKTIYDSFVQPTEEVGDYRTFVSGITAADLEGAPSLDDVRAEVQELLQDKILVGHGLENDLSSLHMEHPWWMTRDTAYYQPFMQERKTCHGEEFWGPRKLKDLCSTKLQREIQIPGKPHSPAEDAIAALDLYKSHRPRWEVCVASQIKLAQKQHLELSRHSYHLEMLHNSQHGLELTTHHSHHEQQQHVFYDGMSTDELYLMSTDEEAYLSDDLLIE